MAHGADEQPDAAGELQPVPRALIVSSARE